LVAAICGYAQAQEACVGFKKLVLVETSQNQLHLCLNEKVEKSFKIAIGRGGTGKKLEGDGKTPLGRYTLGIGRASNRFGTFIPVGYPTAEQKIQGFTGGDIGIHGPDRAFRWAGSLNTWINWTQGCVALGTDDEVLEVSNWVATNNPVSIEIK
jgi:murein L,D-transpeptidase YafK